MYLKLENLAALPLGVFKRNYLSRASSLGIVHIGLGNFHCNNQARYLLQLMKDNQALYRAFLSVGVRREDANCRKKC
tara:strand:+ start:138 stop:368 length:231 start_codon:yes stop_codon:yes gene_type:complete